MHDRLAVTFQDGLTSDGESMHEPPSAAPTSREAALARKAVADLLQRLPDCVSGFQDSQYPTPVRAAILGGQPLDLAQLRIELGATGRDVKHLLPSVLLGAEQVEAGSSDGQQYFLTDRLVQDLVFDGAKWQAGWALLLGSRHSPWLAERLQERDFLVFTDQPNISGTRFLGKRPTAPIYFLQLMVRYGLIWGRIPPGEDHRLSHFLEGDMPGLLIITQELAPLEYLVALGLMQLGAPAVVPSSFPFPYGYREPADDAEGIIARALNFPNLRRRVYKDESIGLPTPLDAANLHERLDRPRRLPVRESFFGLRAVTSVGPRLLASGSSEDCLGIEVEVAADRLGPEVEQQLEKTALGALNFIPGLRALKAGDALRVDLAAGVEFDPRVVGEAIYWGLRRRYPRLAQISTHVIRDARLFAESKAELLSHVAARDARVSEMSEANTDEFAVCLECRTFSLEHICILTPGRLPMCAARTYASVKAAVALGSDDVPWSRPKQAAERMRRVILKGELLDPDRGEYAGCNRVYRELSDGRLARVHLHSIRDYPTTSCGCFQALAFWIPEVSGIGVMRRDAAATTPNGESWAMLANRAGGKQSPGIAGISLQYLASPAFLKGDGGPENVVWVDSSLKKLLARVAPDVNPATEREVGNLAELARFVGHVAAGLLSAHAQPL